MVKLTVIPLVVSQVSIGVKAEEIEDKVVPPPHEQHIVAALNPDVPSFRPSHYQAVEPAELVHP